MLHSLFLGDIDFLQVIYTFHISFILQQTPL